MNPHGEDQSVRYRLGQVGRGRGIHIEQSSAPSISLGRGSSAVPLPSGRVLGRGALLELGRYTTITPDRSLAGLRSYGYERSNPRLLESGVQNITLGVHEMHLEESQHVPAPTERSAETEKPAAKAKSSSGEKRSSKGKTASGEKRSSKGKTASGEKRSSKGKAGSEERRAARPVETQRLASTAGPVGTGELGAAARRDEREEPAASARRAGAQRLAITAGPSGTEDPTASGRRGEREEPATSGRRGEGEKPETSTRRTGTQRLASTAGPSGTGELGAAARRDEREEPAASGRRGEGEKPETSTRRTGTQRLAITAGPSGTEDPAVSGRRGERDKPEASGRRGEREEPAASGRRGEREEPAASGRRGERDKPATSGRRGKREEPAASARGTGTEEFGASGRRGERDKPEASGRRGEREEPETSTRRTGTQRLAITAGPSGTEDPAASGRRGERDKPATSGRRGKREEPAASGRGTGTEEFGASGKRGERDKPEASGRRGEREEPETSTRRTGTQRLAITAGPSGTEEPAASGRRGEREEPETSTRRTGTQRLAITAGPSGTEDPAASGRRGEREEPAASGRGTGTEEFGTSGRRGEREEPEATVTASRTRAPRPAPLPRFSSKSPSEEFELSRKTSTLLTNYVRLQTDPDICVYEYEITFSPDIEYASFRYKLLYDQFKGKKDVLCYDGSLKLFTPERITDGVEEFALLHPVEKSEVFMRVKLKKRAEAKDCAVVYNTLFNNCSRLLRFTRFGNKYFDSEEAIDIPQHKLEIWPGYVTAIDEFDGGIQLRCDVNHRVLRTETVLDVLRNISHRGPEYMKAMAMRDLIGQCVLTRYNNSFYRIDDIDWTKNPLSTFPLQSGEHISFIQYYKRQYNLDITDTEQPLLINLAKNGTGGKGNMICLVPEICHMTGLSDRMRKDMKVMKDIARYTRITPNQRIYAFKKFLQNVKNNQEVKTLLKKWGLKIKNEFVQLKAKNFDVETLLFGNDVAVKAVDHDWAKSLRSLNVYRPVDFHNWIIFYPGKNRQVAEDFTHMVKRIGPGLGLLIEEPKKVSLRDDRIETYLNSLRAHIKRDTQIVVCICPTAREDRYNAIKKLCCQEIPIPSQVVNMITLSREDRMRPVVQNIALQMNHKLGGAGWAIQLPFSGMMVCGVDVYHDKSRSSGSVGAFVASTNDDCTEWFSKTNFQGPNEELISGIVDAFASALRAYHKKNDTYPDRIVVFRDGVSDGQLDICLNYEVPQFLKTFKIPKYEYCPEFAYIIVQKRISTKLYDMSGKEAGNPRPGVVVDSVITKKNYLDFYLVSQLVRCGTASPTHYIVLYDNSESCVDYLQRLTYQFCHLYYNWPGTIRVPAPCQYAHKLAYLVGQNIKGRADDSLDNKLFYL